MPFSLQWVFGPFRLDQDHACLWCAAQTIPLPPKVFAVLHYLVTHPDRLVTKDELLEAVWPETAVRDAVVRVAIGALRKILGDTAQTPRFIATVPRPGAAFAGISGPGDQWGAGGSSRGRGQPRPDPAGGLGAGSGAAGRALGQAGLPNESTATKLRSGQKSEVPTATGYHSGWPVAAALPKLPLEAQEGLEIARRVLPCKQLYWRLKPV
jgi:hypothetical protein